MFERDLAIEFNNIIRQYKLSPFGFKLRKTGLALKLIEYNGLLYLDIENLYRIVDELLGPNISREIKKYLEKITFSEVITVEKVHYVEQMTLTCTQFVDNFFFSKCIDWIKENDTKNNSEFLFSDMNSNRSDFYGAMGYQQFDENLPIIDEDYPFRHIWKMDSPRGNILDNERIKNTDYTREQIGLSKPRGKQMNLTEESLKERPFMCTSPFCGRAFKRFEHLKRHMKMHTGDRPFKCSFPDCDKSFSRSDNLSQHMKVHMIGNGKPAGRIYFKSASKRMQRS